MEHDLKTLNILQDIASFSRIKKYKGMLPSKFSQFFDPATTEELISNGYIERLTVSFPCGSEPEFLKLTTEGQTLLRDLRSSLQGVEEELPEELAEDLSKEELQLLNDIYHYSLITKHEGMMPLEKVEDRSPRDLNRLFGKGYVIRVKAETGKSKKRKGLLLTEKGLMVLNAAERKRYAADSSSTPLV